MEGIFGTILVSVILVAIVAFIIARMVINKRAGKRSCGMGCSGCTQNQSCFLAEEELNTDEKKDETIE